MMYCLLPLVVRVRWCGCLGSTSCAYWADNSSILNKHWLSSAGTGVRLSRNSSGCDRLMHTIFKMMPCTPTFVYVVSIRHNCLSLRICIAVFKVFFPALYCCLRPLDFFFFSKPHQGHSSSYRAQPSRSEEARDSHKHGHTSSLSVYPLTVKLMMEEICFCWFGAIKRSQEQSFSSCNLDIALLKAERRRTPLGKVQIKWWVWIIHVFI